jgi:transposase
MFIKKEQKMRKTHNKEFKFKVALEAIKGDLTIAQIVSTYQVAESLVHRWRKQLLDQGNEIFTKDLRGQEEKASLDVEKLHAKIGKLTLERDFLEDALLKVPGKSAKK